MSPPGSICMLEWANSPSISMTGTGTLAGLHKQTYATSRRSKVAQQDSLAV